MPRGATPGAVYLGEGVRREGYCRARTLRPARVITAAMFSTVHVSNPASQVREARSPSESGTRASTASLPACPEGSEVVVGTLLMMGRNSLRSRPRVGAGVPTPPEGRLLRVPRAAGGARVAERP